MKRFSGTVIAILFFAIALVATYGVNFAVFTRDADPSALEEIRSPLAPRSSDESGAALVEVAESPRAVSETIPDHRRRLRAFFGRSDGDWDVHVYIEQASPHRFFRVDLPFRIARDPEDLGWEREHLLRIPVEDAYGIPATIALDLDTLAITPATPGTHREHSSHETP